MAFGVGNKTTGGLLRRGLLSTDCEGQYGGDESRHNTGEDELDSIHGFITTIIQSRTLDGKKRGAVGWIRRNLWEAMSA